MRSPQSPSSRGHASRRIASALRIASGPSMIFRAFAVAVAFVSALAIAIVLASPAAAQVDERPSTQRPPSPEPGLAPPIDLELPKIEPPDAEGRLAQGLEVTVERFDFEGNTAIASETLRAELAGYVGHAIDSEELLEARDRITQLYIDRGYVTSGAVIPDQPVRDGRVLMHVVEGRLEEVEVEGARRFQPRYFRERLLRAAGTPLDVTAVELALQRFQQDPLIEQVVARLEPTDRSGHSRLRLSVVEARQEDLRLVAENDRSPAVGEEAGVFHARAANLVGLRDELAVSGWFTEGLKDVEARYAIPISAWDTRAEARVRWSESDIVEFPFDPLDIESESLTVSLGVYQPIHRSRQHTVELGLRGDWRKGRSKLSGQLFCFQPGVTDCTPSIAVLRLVASWRWQLADQAIAARSMFSWGTGWLGATTRPGNVPDGRFFSWLAQAQYARRAPLDSQLRTRVDFQLTGDPLLSFERIAVGGLRTVRGYRPNQLVRDSGVIASLSWSLPVWKRSIGPAWVELTPFFDVGHAWNERFDSGDNTIASAGLSALFRPHERVTAELAWGGRLVGVDRVGSGLIGEGIHFRVEVDAW